MTATALPVTGLSHVTVTVTDLDRARRFYATTLGLAELPRPAFRRPGAWFRLDETVSLHLTVKDIWPLRPEILETFETGNPHFALAVDDADATWARLHAAGLHVHELVGSPTGLRQFFLRDPDGNMIELIGPAAAVGAATGQAAQAAAR